MFKFFNCLIVKYSSLGVNTSNSIPTTRYLTSDIFNETYLELDSIFYIFLKKLKIFIFYLCCFHLEFLIRLNYIYLNALSFQSILLVYLKYIFYDRLVKKLFLYSTYCKHNNCFYHSKKSTRINKSICKGVISSYGTLEILIKINIKC